MSWKRPNIGSRVNREVHARFWERAEVKFLRATRQTRPRSHVRVAAALPPTTAVVLQRRERQFRATSRHMQCSKRVLFDHLVGAGEDGRRNLDAQRSRYLEINEEI